MLVFHRAVGFVHQSIPHSVHVIETLAMANGWRCTATDDPSAFDDARLRDFDVVVLLQTSGDVLPESSQRAAFEAFVQRGGGVFAVHAAASLGVVADEWPWLRELIGAAFRGHTAACCFCDAQLEERAGLTYGGPLSAAPHDAEWLNDELAMTTWESATVFVEAPQSPVIGEIHSGDTRSDEWYGFFTNPRDHVNVVATIDETTYEPAQGRMGDDHPIVWWHDYDGGRCVYNSMGHARATWDDRAFQSAVVGGIAFSAQRRTT